MTNLYTGPGQRDYFRNSCDLSACPLRELKASRKEGRKRGERCEQDAES